MLLIAAGGFLLGGAYSVAKLNNDGERGRRGQLAVAAALALVAVYLVIAGILQVSAE